MKKILVPLMIAAAFALALVGCKEPEPEPTPTPGQESGYVKPDCAPFTKQIVDGGFEDCWYKVKMNNEEYYEYQSSVFYSLNNLHAMLDVPSMMLTSSPITAHRETTDPHSGNVCLKLVTGELTDQSKGRLLIPGAIAPLDENFIDQFLNISGNYPDGINVKRAYTEKPTAFKGYFKYLPVNGDYGSICVELYNGSQMIARGYQRFDSNVNAWTSFNIPIDYTVNGGNYSDATPTHISIILSSSGAYNFADLTNCQGEVGSTLWLDDVELDF